ncbi:tight junction protein ZO-1-like isoform X2 [Haliotis asinina]|uniref:tight junction protein ZO-1-like isoform X2 n=1 Tax=Haliotis asinina TaxID=109174 RepID=UPI0035325376
MRRDHRRLSVSLNDVAAGSSKNINMWSSFIDAESGDNVIWETHRVSLTKVPGFGFGIAVSGGRDSPHFANGDPSIAISDVLKAGPAEGRLQVNDRIVTVNNISLENVEHVTAIAVLRDSGNTINLVVRRRIVLPTGLETETPPLKVTLGKKGKKDDFGVVLGCKFFVKEVLPHSLAAQEGAVKEGDTVLKINNTPIDNLSLTDARKLIEKTKDKLQLIITKKKTIDDRHKRQNSQLKEEEILAGYSSLRRQHDKDDINIYRPSVRSEDDIFKPGTLPRDAGLPHGAYPNSDHARYDGRYVLDNEPPPRPPLPTGFDDSSPDSRSPVSGDSYQRKDGYYSDRESGARRETRLDDDRRGPNMTDEDDDVFSGTRHEERYVGLRKDVRPEPRSVVFIKDKTYGLGLSLAGGNATGIFIASVQPGSAAEREGLCEGDQILRANVQDITGLTREEAVAFLKSLEGKVTITVQYRKEEYDRIMASHEAGDDFYVRTHFQYDPQEAGDHGFQIGDIFHVKDTLFRRESESWLAVKLGKNNQESKKGTIPNKKRADMLAQTQQQSSSDKENFPNKGRGSLFKRKAARRAKSLGKDHWEEVIFSDESAGLSTKFPPYERVALGEAGFMRPVVIFGSIADIARERLLSDFPDKFESPQSDLAQDDDRKKSGIIRLGAIREAITKRKHCLLDVTPHHVDRLNYAQYYPITVNLKAESKQAVKDLRSRWKAPAKNHKKIYEHNEKLEKMYSHLFTGTITHGSSDMWYTKLCELIIYQQRQNIWMSDKKPDEDISEDFLFPMPARLSYASPESEMDLHRPYDDFDVSPIQKKRLVRSSSDPSVNTAEHGIPGIPPYPDPPSYHNQRFSPQDRYARGSDPRQAGRPQDNEWHGTQPEDRYYPSYYAQSPPLPHHNRSSIDPYATLTPSERLRNRIASDQQYQLYDEYSPHRYDSGGDVYRAEPSIPKQSSPHHSPHMGQGAPTEQRAHNDSSSHSSDSYSKYVNHPSNKHDDTKLREKLGGVTGRERSPGHDPYRFTRSTANPVNTSNVNKAKISDLAAKYRKDEGPGSPQGRMESHTLPHQKRKEPPPVPAKTFNMKERGIEPDEQKIRNYENSNRHYNYSEVNIPGQRGGGDRYLEPDQYGPVDPRQDTPYEYVAIRNHSAPPRDLRHRSDNQLDRVDNHLDRVHSDHYSNRQREHSYDHAKAFANQMYMDHREIERLRAAKHGGKAPGGEREHYMSPDTRPRTDEAELEERSLQNTRIRARSEPGLADLANPTSKSQKHISWALDSRKENFESYKRLITPGFYGSRRSISSSQELLQGDRSQEKPLPPPPPAPPEQRSSAFETYRKPTSSSPPSPSKPAANMARIISESVKKGPTSRPPPPSLPPPPPPPPLLPQTTPPTVKHPPPPLPPPPNFNSYNGKAADTDKHQSEAKDNQNEAKGNGNEARDIESEASVNESEANSDRSGDTDGGGTSDSVSTPETVILGSDFHQDVDERHTVVATARGVFDADGGVLESRETGVSIVIPKGAIHEGIKQEIYFKVCRDNSILPPLDKDKGETLLSPLVMCGPHGLKFNTPVELRLPHCASVNPESWSFALKSSDSPSGQPTKWQNMSLAGIEGVTQGHVSKNSVSVLVDHF